jgi:hypothetical protein
MTRPEHDPRVARVPRLALLAFTVVASPAIAQKADRPIVRAGDRWQFVEYYGTASTEPNRDWVVTSVTPSRIEGTENGEPLVLNSELNVLESSRSKNSNLQALSFPPEIGKQWQYAGEWVFKVTGSKGSSTIEVEVVDYERVNVSAGDFEAFKLMSKGSIPRRISQEQPDRSRGHFDILVRAGGARHREVDIPQPLPRRDHRRTRQISSSTMNADGLRIAPSHAA